MQEGAVMEIGKLFIGLTLILAMVSLAVFSINLSEVNSFKQHVNYEIERNGGLTDVAMKNIKEHSDEFYGGRFTVVSNQGNQKVEFGEKVDYQVKANVKILFFDLGNIGELSFKGSGTSYVR